MSRDYKSLKFFGKADALVLKIYEVTRTFPTEERFGLQSQIRRAAVSVPTNIVEGCGRTTEKELERFLVISLGSATELRYLIDLSQRLGYISPDSGPPVVDACDEVVRSIQAFLRSIS